MPPEPRPSDLENPVPGAAAAPPDLATFMQSQPKAPTLSDTQATTPPPDLNSFLGAQASKPISQTDKSDVDQNAPSAGGFGEQNIDGQKVTDLRPSSIVENLKELKTLAVANLGKDPGGQLSVWKSAFGDKNAKLINDQIYFRSSSDEKFRPATKGLLDGFANVLASHSRDTAFMAGAAAAGTGLGALGLVGDGIMGAIGTGGVAGAAGGATAQAADNAAKGILGIDYKNSDIASSAEEGGKAGAVISGAAAALTPAAVAATGAISDLADSAGQKIAPYFESNETKLGKILNLYRDITDVAQKSGMNIDTTSPELDSTTIGEKLGGQVYKSDTPQEGRIPALRRELSNRIGAVLDHADMIAGDQSFKVDDGLSKIQELLSKGGIEFKPGQLEVPAELNGEDLEAGREPRVISTNQMAVKPTRGTNPFGESNPAVVDDMVKRYNDLLLQNKLNGFAPSEIANTAKAWQDLGSFDQDLNVKSDAVKSFYRQASNALADERDKVIQQLAPNADPAIQKYFKTAYPEFNQKIQFVQDYLKDFNSKNSAADFADSLLSTKNNYQKVGFLREMLGDDSAEWKAIKGNWFAKMVDNNSSDNFLDPKGMMADLKAYDPKVLDQLIPPDEQASLKYTLDKLKTIPTKDFTKSPEQLDFTGLAIARLLNSPLAVAGRTASLAHKVLFNITRDNGPLADYMAQEGLLSMARDASDPSEKAGYLDAADDLRHAISYSTKVPSSSVGYKYEPSPELEQFLNTIRQNPGPNQSMAPLPPGALPNRRKTFTPNVNSGPRFQPQAPSAQNLGSLFPPP